MTETVEPIVTERPRIWHFDVWRGEDWLDPLPPMVHDLETETPIDLTNVTLEFYARPAFNHATRFILLTTVGSNGITKDAPKLGLATIFYPVASVEANLPITTTQAPWECFMRALYTDPQFGAVQKHLSTGQFRVHPARTAATV
jgi:hypothetical protein